MSELQWLYLIGWICSVAIIIWRYELINKASLKELDEFRNRSVFLENELAACRNKKMINIDYHSSMDNLKETATKTSLNFISEIESINKNDLKIVEGIGPKIEKILNEASIYTFEDLSKVPASTIKKILEQAGSHYLVHNPTTWPKQAQLANEGKWDELKKWQNELDKGRIVQ